MSLPESNLPDSRSPESVVRSAATSAAAAPTAIIAEDEPLLADELADLLQALWPQLRIVARVRDGVAALDAIETHQPHVAFLDIHMPLLSGIEVARQIAAAATSRSSPRTTSPRVQRRAYRNILREVLRAVYWRLLF
ncbi:MAG TPA: response regulator [Burkholderiaceae bacterium]|nr:response regulator [Burkholderiaceae bacterium]